MGRTKRGVGALRHKTWKEISRNVSGARTLGLVTLGFHVSVNVPSCVVILSTRIPHFYFEKGSFPPPPPPLPWLKYKINVVYNPDHSSIIIFLVLGSFLLLFNIFPVSFGRARWRGRGIKQSSSCWYLDWRFCAGFTLVFTCDFLLLPEEKIEASETPKER